MTGREEPDHISRAMLATEVAKWMRAFFEVRSSTWLGQRCAESRTGSGNERKGSGSVAPGVSRPARSHRPGSPGARRPRENIQIFMDAALPFDSSKAFGAGLS